MSAASKCVIHPSGRTVCDHKPKKGDTRDPREWPICRHCVKVLRERPQLVAHFAAALGCRVADIVLAPPPAELIRRASKCRTDAGEARNLRAAEQQQLLADAMRGAS